MRRSEGREGDCGDDVAGRVAAQAYGVVHAAHGRLAAEERARGRGGGSEDEGGAQANEESLRHPGR